MLLYVCMCMYTTEHIVCIERERQIYATFYTHAYTYLGQLPAHTWHMHTHMTRAAHLHLHVGGWQEPLVGRTL